MPTIPWLNFYDRLVARYHPRFRPNENLGRQTQLCTVPAECVDRQRVKTVRQIKYSGSRKAV